MMIWDIEGKTDFKPIFKQYLLGSKGFVIVADLTREKTLASIEEHIGLCEKAAPNLPIIIALNKSDIRSVDYDIDKLKELSSSIIGIYETSAKSGETVNEIFSTLNNKIIERSK